MKTVEIELPAPLDDELAAEVAKQAVYASQGVRAFGWDASRRRALVQIEPGMDAADTESKVRRLVAAMVARHRVLPKKIVRTNTRKDRGAVVAHAETELEQRGFLRKLGPGQMALSGPPLAFVQALDARISAMARTRFGAREEAYPAMIPSEVLHRVGYINSFPHAVSMVTHLVEDFDAIERFHRANVEAPSLVIPERSALAHPSVCLAPAVCYHFYPSLENSVLREPLVVVTAAGRCFRYESKNMSGLERLWDFTMREVIFCGDEASVLAFRPMLLEAAANEAAELDLDFVVESASDPFFSADYAQKTYWQARNDLKFELRLAISPAASGSTRSTAAASFNLHEDHFGKTFAFASPDGAAGFTGCAAWGLERWALAAFAQHGLTPSRWPEAWRSEVFS